MPPIDHLIFWGKTTPLSTSFRAFSPRVNGIVRRPAFTGIDQWRFQSAKTKIKGPIHRKTVQMRIFGLSDSFPRPFRSQISCH